MFGGDRGYAVSCSGVSVLVMMSTGAVRDRRRTRLGAQRYPQSHEVLPTVHDVIFQAALVAGERLLVHGPTPTCVTR